MAHNGSQYSLEALLPHKVEERWPSIVKLVEKWLAEGQGEYILTDILQYLKTGEWQCWVIRKEGKVTAIAVTTETSFPQYKAMNVVGVAGVDMKGWLVLLPELEDWARICGCKKLRGCGRSGWDRVLKPFGFQKEYNVMAKDV